jgi:hypothetical protein
MGTPVKSDLRDCIFTHGDRCCDDGQSWSLNIHIGSSGFLYPLDLPKLPHR